MTHSYFIRNQFNIKDLNISLDDSFDTDLTGTLTYTPAACPCCGALYQSNKDIIRNGFLQTRILLGMINYQPTYLKLKKQRFLCRHCGKSFSAQTDLAAPHCFISFNIRQMILLELRETQSMTAIAKHLNVSINTVIRVLEEDVQLNQRALPVLPDHLSIDEFKSVKNVKGAMSCILANNRRHKVFDILPDRTQSSLQAYFSRYTLEERKKVKTITMDMYSPYYHFLKVLFPNAKIIIDRFHIVQLLNRTLNQLRVKAMNGLRTKQPRDYKKLKQQWKLILKNADKLDFEKFRTHRLYDGLMTEKGMVDYLLSLDTRLSQAHDWINRIKWAIQEKDFAYLEYTLQESHKYQFSRPLRKSFNSLERYIDGIKNACDYTLSNGYIEGINNKIKLLKRTGYGYRRFDHLKKRILLSQIIEDKKDNKKLRPLTFEEERQVQLALAS